MELNNPGKRDPRTRRLKKICIEIFWISQDEIIDGKRDIASYYYPLIGPYATNDDRVLDYHFELMKLAKVDGIILDWYGEVGSNGDIDQAGFRVELISPKIPILRILWLFEIPILRNSI